MSSTGYTVKQLKEVVPASTVLYVRPIQSDLDMTVVQNEDRQKACTQCVNCHESVLLVGIKEHADFCNGGNSILQLTFTQKLKPRQKSRALQEHFKGKSA